ncbi:hypothetical protein, partial [Methylobacterium sp.]
SQRGRASRRPARRPVGRCRSSRRRPLAVALAAAEARAARRPAAVPGEMTAEDIAWLHALPDYEPPAAPAPARRPTDGAWLRDLLMQAR